MKTAPLFDQNDHGGTAGVSPFPGNSFARTLNPCVKAPNRSFNLMSRHASPPESATPHHTHVQLPSSRSPLLAVKGLRKHFGGQVVLDGIDLELRQGEVVLLRGENGSGKTTLLNILTGNLEPDAGIIEYSADDSPRTYRFPRLWWQELNPWDHFRPEFVAKEGIGRTWQDVRLFRAQSLRDNIAVAAPNQPGENPALALLAPGRVRRAEQEISAEADAMLARLGLAGRETSSADKISLGQSKRVAIARAVAAGARILFLDEPLAGLDRPGIANVLGLLEHLVYEQGVTLVVVEHVFNLAHLQGLVTTDWLLENGRIQKTSEKVHVLPPANVQCPPSIQERPWLSFLADSKGAVTDEPLPHGATLTRIRPATDKYRDAKPALEIRNLVVRRGARIVIGLDDEERAIGFNLTLLEGEIAVLQAPNGWGKSSLFAAISGLIPVDQGEILIKGQSVVRMPVWKRIRQGVRFVQSDHNIFPFLSAKETLRLAGRTDVKTALGTHSNCRANELSGGQKQRLALLAEPRKPAPRVRMFDEPFANLDAKIIHEAAQEILAHSTSAVLVALPSTAK